MIVIDSPPTNFYDPLAQARAELDRAVDLCYRPEKFATDQQIDQLVYELYNLTPDEIKLVEGGQ